MSRFTLISLLALVVFLTIGFCSRGRDQLYCFTAFWIVYLTVAGFGVFFIQLQFFCPATCQGPTRQKQIALTFDDGPDPQVTPALLDLLQKEKIPATFFCIGKNVTAHPHLAKRIVTEGHLIANHTFDHHWYTACLGRRALTNQLKSTQSVIQSATGTTPVYFRPPMGHTNPNYKSVLQKLNLQMIGWNVRSLDTLAAPETVIKTVLQNTTPGSIILLHDANTTSETFIPMLTEIIRGLRRKNFEFASIYQLTGSGKF